MSSEMDKFKAVTSKSCVDQAKFFLNAFWKEYSNDAETIWVYVHKFAALDNKGKATQDLDEFNAHRFLEQVGETLRVVELRDTLRAIDLDFNKRMALIEYLLFKYKQSIKELLSRPQGMNEELMKAQQALEAVQQEITNIEIEGVAHQGRRGHGREGQRRAQRARAAPVCGPDRPQPRADHGRGGASQGPEERQRRRSGRPLVGQPGTRGGEEVQAPWRHQADCLSAVLAAIPEMVSISRRLRCRCVFSRELFFCRACGCACDFGVRACVVVCRGAGFFREERTAF
eukprot:Opistho-1_new@36447